MFKTSYSRKELAARIVSPLLFIVLVALGAASYAEKSNQTLGAIAITGAVLLAGMMARTLSADLVSSAHFALFSGLALSAVSLIGLGMWLEADWFADPGPFAQNLWSGYDSRHFIGLVMLTVAAPAGVTLSVVGLHMLARSRNPRRARFYNAMRFGYGLVCAGLGGAGTWWGWIMGRCLGAFCLNPEVWTPAPVGSRPTAGYGWMATVGITAFFSLLPIGCIMCVASARSLTARWHARVADMDAPSGAVRAPFRLHRTALDINMPLRPTRRHLVWFLVRSSVTFLVLLAFAVVSMYMPNSWEYFAADRIAQQAQWTLSLNYTLCNTPNAQGNYPYTCSDYPWAYFGAWNIILNAGWWTIRLFPSSVFWFSYMLLLLAGATLLTAAGRRSDRLTRQRKLSFGPLRVRLSLAQILGGTLTVGMLSLFAVYWFHDHNFDTMGGPNDTGIAYSERYARAFGQMAVALMGLLIFPASRSSIVHTTLGTSWEGLIWVHRILGYGMLSCTVAHVIAWWVKFGQIGLFRDIFQVPMTMPTNADNFTVPLVTVTTFILLISMGILALEPVRRRAFELFYYAHLFAVYTTVPAVLWHAAAGWEYLLPGLTVWFADRLLRHVRSSRAATITEQRLCADDVVTLRFHQADLEVRPGQYVFVHIAELSALEWHPFTVSSVDNERHSFTLHIKAMQPPSEDAPPPAYLSWLPAPKSTWTQRLKRAVVNKIPLTLSVDGPCGPLHDFAHFRQILLVAGGIGVTPCAALVERLRANMKLERLQLHWATRDAALAQSFAAQLDPIPGDPRYHGVLYVTRPVEDVAIDSLPLRVVAGRPNLDRIMDSMYDPKDPDPSSTLVFVCGTRGMVESCASLAIAKGFTFHEETFFL